MNTILRLSLSTLVIASVLLCCKKKEEPEPTPPTPPTNPGSLWGCHHQNTWDSISTRNALIGQWEWTFISCYWNPEDANDTDFKGLTLEFKTDGSLIVKENGQIAQTSTWKIVHSDSDLFAVQTNPIVPQLYGRILFCDDQVEFNDSYVDGCDDYFKRIN